MSRSTLFLVAGVVAAAGVGWWWWKRSAAQAAPAGQAPVRVAVGGTVRQLVAGDPGYATARALADAAERRENTGASHF